MAAPSVTNTFTAVSAALASQVNTNFSQIVAGLKSGSTWDVVVKSLTTVAATITTATITNGNITTATISGAATVGTTLDVTGNATVGGTFDATGNATSGGTLDVTGAATVGGTLGVTGELTLDATSTNIDAAAPTVDFGAASAWVINDVATVDFAAVTKLDVAAGVLELASATELDLSACAKIDMGGAKLPSGSSPDADTLYTNSMCKAWAHIDNTTVTDGFNIAGATNVVGDRAITFHTNMANGDISVLVTSLEATGVHSPTVSATGVGGFTVRFYDKDGNKETGALSFSVLVFGDQ